jgi:hypothetical protein
MEIELDREIKGRRRGADGDVGSPRAVAFSADADVVTPRRDVVEPETAILVGTSFAPQFVDDDHGACERHRVLGLRDPATQGRTRGLGGYRGGQYGKDRDYDERGQGGGGHIVPAYLPGWVAPKHSA